MKQIDMSVAANKNPTSLFDKVYAWITWIACLSLGAIACTTINGKQAPVAQPISVTERAVAPGSASATQQPTVSRSAEILTFFEMTAADELLEFIASGLQPSAEGENSLGCRIEVTEANASRMNMKPLLQSELAQERAAYLENPAAYSRKHGFDRCAPSCTCSGLAAVLKSVDSRSIHDLSVRSAHREYVKKLAAKTARQTAAEHRLCVERQGWFCGSALRGALRGDASHGG